MKIAKQDSLINKIGRKPLCTGMTQRKDVVLKCLLRKIRKTIKKHFLCTFRRSIRKNGKSYEAIKERLKKKYILKHMSSPPTESLIDDLGIFACFEMIETSLDQIQNQVHRSQLSQSIKSLRDLLYKFNFTRFEKIIKIPNMCNVILHFEHIQDFNQLNNNEKLGFKILSDEWIKAKRLA